MGLAEKRAMKAAQDGWLPKRSQELADISGGSMAFEVEWDSFDGDAKGIDWLEHNGAAQVANAFRMICQDALGKEAVAEAIKKVVLRNAAEAEVAVNDGVLEVQGTFSQGPKGTVRDKQIRACVEAAL